MFEIMKSLENVEVTPEGKRQWNLKFRAIDLGFLHIVAKSILSFQPRLARLRKRSELSLVNIFETYRSFPAHTYAPSLVF